MLYISSLWAFDIVRVWHTLSYRGQRWFNDKHCAYCLYLRKLFKHSFHSRVDMLLSRFFTSIYFASHSSAQSMDHTAVTWRVFRSRVYERFHTQPSHRRGRTFHMIPRNLLDPFVHHLFLTHGGWRRGTKQSSENNANYLVLSGVLSSILCIKTNLT